MLINCVKPVKNLTNNQVSRILDTNFPLSTYTPPASIVVIINYPLLVKRISIPREKTSPVLANGTRGQVFLPLHDVSIIKQ